MAQNSPSTAKGPHMFSQFAKFLILLPCLFIFACAAPGPKSGKSGPTPAPEKPALQYSDVSYTVRGKKYFILASAKGYDETGLATWYGGRFHGRKTASGERFNRNKLTAAHKTLPFGARVQITNPQNGQQVTVKINDRGPFSDDHIIDLSQAAARAIGMHSTMEVRVEAVE